MILLDKIKRKGDMVEVYVKSMDRWPPQYYKMVFNYKTREYECTIDNPEPFDVHKIMYKLAMYIKKKKRLPKVDSIYWG